MSKDASSYDIIDFWNIIDDLAEYDTTGEDCNDELQKQVEEYLTNADEIPFLTLPDLITALWGVRKICEAAIAASDG